MQGLHFSAPSAAVCSIDSRDSIRGIAMLGLHTRAAETLSRNPLSAESKGVAEEQEKAARERKEAADKASEAARAAAMPPLEAEPEGPEAAAEAPAGTEADSGAETGAETEAEDEPEVVRSHKTARASFACKYSGTNLFQCLTVSSVGVHHQNTVSACLPLPALFVTTHQ